ncbi:MAG: hypothetical protein K1X89_23285 [Myxococcaceae bacterium]|nr:hypothetical protein [Myxococcaceae bacterium]
MRSVFLAVLCSTAAFAQGSEVPGGSAAPAAMADSDSADAKAAKTLVTKYLTLVKAKKWADAKKLLHPKTVASIAERKKRLGKEDHAMAPWAHEKDEYYLTNFKVLAAREAANGTVVVATSEDNYQVDVKGIAEGDQATYLVGKVKGTWYLVDKKRNETFSNDSVKLGYKGWFDEVPKADKAEAAPAE